MGFRKKNENTGRPTWETSVKHSGSAFETGSAFNLYDYNSRSEVMVGDKYWGANLNDTSDPVKGQGFAYTYDNIGNRTTASRDSKETTYTANNLNQYSQRTVNNLIDVIGSAENSTTVTINDLATTRHGKYWHKELGVTNDSDAVYQPVNVVGVYNPPGTNNPDVVTVQSGKVFVAKTPEAFTYDDDGNLLSDGRFSYTWDAENRLIAAETLTTLPASVPRVKVEFVYDYMSRRVSKTVSHWVSNDWNVVETRTNVFNGWDLLRETVVTSQQATTNWYVHGLDVSGSLSGAGGIGGLLAVRLGTNNVCYTFDGNGNVSELVEIQSGTIAAHYEFSPFGETIVATGPLAKENPFRFSAKYFVDELGIGDWGRRWYHPSSGRWLSRDPLQEVGGINLYGFCANDSVNDRDPFGLSECKSGKKYVDDYIKELNCGKFFISYINCPDGAQKEAEISQGDGSHTAT